ncbi:MAG: hypothetical protein SFY92_04590 [Verrucomicrobiae bacterium]|nr:hypothetical protein [Verrucomicrobiae bacterium]
MKSNNRIKKVAPPKKAKAQPKVHNHKPSTVFCVSCGVRLSEANHSAPHNGVCNACRTAQGQKEAEAARRKQSQTVAGLKHATYVKRALKGLEPWLN